jgi:hypothetical protein
VARIDPRLAPAYTVAQAAHDLRIPAPTVRSWVLGRDYPRRSGQGRFDPVISLPEYPEHRLSFRNLIELAALRALRTEHEFKLSAVRAALASSAFTPCSRACCSASSGSGVSRSASSRWCPVARTPAR